MRSVSNQVLEVGLLQCIRENMSEVACTLGVYKSKISDI